MNKAGVTFVLLASAALIGGCGKRDADATALYNEVFSDVYKEFGAAALCAAGTIAVEDQKQGGSWNAKTLRGNMHHSGILKVTGGAGHCGEVLKRAEAFVASKTGMYSIEGDAPASVDGTQKHVYTVWMYNLNNRHGELRMWLFPYPDSDRVGFAVHHYEENLR
ncbi:MAG: hypothetical protein IH624_06420 [Phycisphaerae bacterium]|nr:hypothetical protein [Phycisphaerae bacterium]